MTDKLLSLKELKECRKTGKIGGYRVNVEYLDNVEPYAKRIQQLEKQVEDKDAKIDILYTKVKNKDISDYEIARELLDLLDKEDLCTPPDCNSKDRKD